MFQAIGFNEPLSPFNSRTRVKWLVPATLEQNAPNFADGASMPRQAITMGVGTILDCRRCLLLATGAEKAEMIAGAVEGPMTSMVSATALQLHPDCTVIVAAAAGSRLKGSRHYRRVFESDPKWKLFREPPPAIAAR